ncbi:hypothetical protein NF701_10075 [Sphingomonadaceae bacterium OTU29THOMA1]|nr:hypothetical protein NF701_10075 [Sphingomonadaceae bacterium OTU29THOMA1]
MSEISAMMHNIQRTSKKRRQIFISSHSEALLSNQGIDASGVLLVEQTETGSTIRGINPREYDAIKDGFSIAEIVLPSTRPPSAKQLSLALQ